MKILIIEDEAKTAKFLKKGLSEAGYVVDVAADGLEGLHLAMEVDFDLIVLDVMLPGLEGWQVLTRLRAAEQKKRNSAGWSITNPNSRSGTRADVPSSMPNCATVSAFIGAAKPGTAGMADSIPT